eukprot:364963-Chlamydomonas_euryale.AAC.17
MTGLCPNRVHRCRPSAPATPLFPRQHDRDINRGRHPIIWLALRVRARGLWLPRARGVQHAGVVPADARPDAQHEQDDGAVNAGRAGRPEADEGAGGLGVAEGHTWEGVDSASRKATPGYVWRGVHLPKRGAWVAVVRCGFL